MNFKS